MPDISMCMNGNCPSKDKCYRYVAPPAPGWQTYGDFRVPKGRKKCIDFLKVHKK